MNALEPVGGEGVSCCPSGLGLSRITLKQAAFVREYAIDCNATQAAVRAGYSPRTAQVQGARLLSKAMVQEALRRRQVEAAQRADMTKGDILSRLIEIADGHSPGVSAADKLSAIREINRMLGFHKKPEAKDPVQFNLSIRASMTPMPGEELPTDMVASPTQAMPAR